MYKRQLNAVILDVRLCASVVVWKRKRKGAVTLSKAIYVIVSTGSLQCATVNERLSQWLHSQTRFSTTVISEQENYFLLLRITIAAVGFVWLLEKCWWQQTANKSVQFRESLWRNLCSLAFLLFNVAGLKETRAQTRVNIVKMLTALTHHLLAL